MKKILKMTALCMAACMLFTACGSKDNKKWIDEGASMLGQDIRRGEFVLNGEVYTFPMDLSVWLDRGWHVSNNYDNKDEFTLAPGEMSTEFELFNEDKEYVTVAVFNVSEEETTVENCMVASIHMSLTDLKAVFPGGINTSNKPADIFAAYGEPDVKDDSESEFIKADYGYTSSDGWDCAVELSVFDNNYTSNPLTSVEYILLESGENWDRFLLNAGEDEACIRFIDTAMKASFYGDFTDYVQYYTTEDDAQALYDAEVDYYADVLMHYSDINSEYIDSDTIEEFREIARQVLAKIAWEVTAVNLDTETLTGTVDLALYPTDFFDLISGDIDSVIGDYQTKYVDVDYNNISEYEMGQMEQDYAEMVLSAIHDRASQTQAVGPVTKTYDIDFGNGIISDADWEEIDDIIMGLSE